MVSSAKPQAPQIHIVNISPQHVAQLEEVQRIVFYTLTEDELFTAPKFQQHIRLFPEGQFVALARVNGQEIPVGSTSTFLTTWKFANTPHTFLEAIDSGWFSNHNPNGDWLYGADISVLPAYRGFGIGRKLYAARAELVRRMNLRGEVAGGMIPGYEHFRGKLTVEHYVDKVKDGEIFDPTLSVQMKNGFVPHHVMRDHITDPRADNCAVLIVRKNADYIHRHH